MRKTAITLLLMAASVAAYAQNAYDALRFSENNYEGTARSTAMGNAFTALGGDLGSITINPAGSAVAGYSQISITPAFTISSNTLQGVPPPEDGREAYESLPYFGNASKSNRTRFNIPNLAMTYDWETGRKTGLKSMTFGFILNKTAGWDEDLYAKGRNNTTSFMGQMAAEATELGYLGADLGANDAYDFMPWKAVAAYQSGMISTYGGYDNQFVGASEGFFGEDIAVAGTLDQSYGRRTSGSKYDYVFNFGANISDFLYLGANLGVNTLDYSSSEYFKESAVDPSDFEINFDDGSAMYFEQMKYDYSYSVSGSGVFAKVGFILTPAGGLRIGGAIQTPTVVTLNEEWRISASTKFSDKSANGSSSSPYGEYTYRLRTPMRANFGVAYTLGTLAILSADYEVCNYKGMRFSSYDEDLEEFEEVNRDIKSFFGMGHTFRAGVEVRPVSTLAVRAGFNAMTSPEKMDYWGNEVKNEAVKNVSFGLGYNSKRSFFADFAVRGTMLPKEYIMPYADYLEPQDGKMTYSPELVNKASLWKVFLTFGWRF